jgi:hypothetical protein
VRTARDVDRFDRRAGSYERDWRAEFHRLVVVGSAKVALAAVAGPADLLDVGRGTGALLRTLAERLPPARTLAGVDPAPSMIERAPSSPSAGCAPWPPSAAAAPACAPSRSWRPSSPPPPCTPKAWHRVYDLGPLPLVQAVTAAPGGTASSR